MGRRYKLKAIRGGKCMANAIAINNSIVASVHSTKVETISDWEELAAICSASAKEKGLTEKDSRRILQRVRQMNEDNY
jgi:hypothetical protein